MDDTNLRSRTCGTGPSWPPGTARTFEVHDFTDVPLDECLRRDAARPAADQVGEEAIRRLHERYLAGRTLPLPVPHGPHRARPPPCTAPSTGRRRSSLVDIDGTVALMPCPAARTT